MTTAQDPVKLGKGWLREVSDVGANIGTVNDLTMKILGFTGKRQRNEPLYRLIEAGLPIKSVVGLAEYIGVTEAKFSFTYLWISGPTLTRRRKAGALTVGESDRAVRYARLFADATEMMEGNKGAARGWLNAEQPLLAGDTPLDHAQTEAGAREVDQLIGRIEHGVFS
ncbi:MAG: hypothetical protein DRR06_13880 [Gammaproteobacteria bacterium]|nr:MAG: hypothetical protein DRR06_13880 [Gammaproteobacteria bacterium]